MHIVYSGIKRSRENEINNNKNKNVTGGDYPSSLIYWQVLNGKTPKIVNFNKV
jgi:hypothetical protein